MGQNEFRKLIGKRLADAREKKGLKLRELSERTGNRLSVARISNYEQGTRLLPPWEALALATALEVRASYLMCLEETQIVPTPEEEKLLRNWRALPENERTAFATTIEVQSLRYRTPVPNSKVEHFSTKIKERTKKS